MDLFSEPDTKLKARLTTNSQPIEDMGDRKVVFVHYDVLIPGSDVVVSGGKVPLDEFVGRAVRSPYDGLPYFLIPIDLV